MLDALFSGIFDTALTTTITPGAFVLCVGVSLLIGLILCTMTLWRSNCTRSFAVTLAILPAVVCVVILMVNGNVGTGVAVAGAFNLVRFRSAPGSAREIGAIFVAMGTGLMAGMGGSTAYSVASARGDTRAADSAFTHSMIIGAAIVVVLLPVGIFLSPWIAGLLGASGDTLPMTEIYIKVLLLFSPAFVFNNIIACFVRNDGAPRLAMLSMIAGSFANIVLDYVFIFLF